MNKFIFYCSCKFLFFIILFFNIFSIALADTSRVDNNRALEQRFISKLDRDVTFIRLGGVELGRDWGIDTTNRKLPSEEVAKQILTTAMDQHISVVDTAASYQLSEDRIGRYIPPSHYSYLLITKVGEHSLLANDPQCTKPRANSIYCEHPQAAYDFSRDAIYRE